jgi:hypothetical protein
MQVYRKNADTSRGATKSLQPGNTSERCWGIGHRARDCVAGLGALPQRRAGHRTGSEAKPDCSDGTQMDATLQSLLAEQRQGREEQQLRSLLAEQQRCAESLLAEQRQAREEQQRTREDQKAHNEAVTGVIQLLCQRLSGGVGEANQETVAALGIPARRAIQRKPRGQTAQPAIPVVQPDDTQANRVAETRRAVLAEEGEEVSPEEEGETKSKSTSSSRKLDGRGQAKSNETPMPGSGDEQTQGTQQTKKVGQLQAVEAGLENGDQRTDGEDEATSDLRARRLVDHIQAKCGFRESTPSGWLPPAQVHHRMPGETKAKDGTTSRPRTERRTARCPTKGRE